MTTFQLPTTGTIESRIGKIELNNGYPTEATAKKLYDDIDFQRACQGYLWALPMMGMVQWQAEQHDKFGAGNLDFVDYLTGQWEVLRESEISSGFQASDCQQRRKLLKCLW